MRILNNLLIDFVKSDVHEEFDSLDYRCILLLLEIILSSNLNIDDLKHKIPEPAHEYIQAHRIVLIKIQYGDFMKNQPYFFYSERPCGTAIVRFKQKTSTHYIFEYIVPYPIGCKELYIRKEDLSQHTIFLLHVEPHKHSNDLSLVTNVEIIN